MVVLAEPAPEDMVRAVRKAIDMLPGIDPQVMHLRVSLNSCMLHELAVHLQFTVSAMGSVHYISFFFSLVFSGKVICKFIYIDLVVSNMYLDEKAL